MLASSRLDPFSWLFVAYVIFASLRFRERTITNAAVSGMPGQPGRCGHRSTSRQIGQTLGVPSSGLSLEDGRLGHTDLAAASHAGWWTLADAASLLVLAFVVTTGAPSRARSAPHVSSTRGARGPTH